MQAGTGNQCGSRGLPAHIIPHADQPSKRSIFVCWSFLYLVDHDESPKSNERKGKAEEER